MRTLLLAGLAALGLAGCSTSGPVATSYAPAAYVATPVRVQSMAYAAEPTIVAPAPVTYRTAAPPLASAPVAAYSYESVSYESAEYYEPEAVETYGYSGGAGAGGCSELVVC